MSNNATLSSDDIRNSTSSGTTSIWAPCSPWVAKATKSVSKICVGLCTCTLEKKQDKQKTICFDKYNQNGQIKPRKDAKKKM